MRKGTVVKDLDTIELYEWACKDIMQDIDFSETFGVLRLRWVKANPKSAAGVSCLQTCVLHWDLVNAQQVSTSFHIPQTAKLTARLDCSTPRQVVNKQQRPSLHVLEHHSHLPPFRTTPVPLGRQAGTELTKTGKPALP